jgi:Transposase DDE domain group 1
LNKEAANASEGLKSLSQMKPTFTASSGTDCNKQPLIFQDLGRRKVVVDFSAGRLSSDGGVLLLRQADTNLGLSCALAACFEDGRDQRFVDHGLPGMLAQRIYGQALGYEDLNDHQELRRDPLMATACGKEDPLGENRFNPADRGFALAAPSTLNRLELSNNRQGRCHKLPHDPAKIEACLLKLGVRCLPKHTPQIVLDLDAMGYLLHGTQEGRHFSRYYGNYCYLPLYVFVGTIPLWAQLRTNDRDSADGVVRALEQIVGAIRRRCKWARIIVRADSGFCREEVMAWCERQQPVVYYCLGLGKNSVLVGNLAPALADARAGRCLSGAPQVRRFAEFEYRTTASWSRSRRVIAKAEVMAEGDNPRFVVTNLPARRCKGQEDQFSPKRLYEELYCARGEMENMLKQQVLDLEADRMSSHYLGSNQLRLWFATFAYLLIERVRALGLAGTELARATVGSVRLKLLKVAAQVSVSVRRVYVQLSSAYPYKDLFGICHRRFLQAARPGG